MEHISGNHRDLLVQMNLFASVLLNCEQVSMQWLHTATCEAIYEDSCAQHGYLVIYRVSPDIHGWLSRSHRL